LLLREALLESSEHSFSLSTSFSFSSFGTLRHVASLFSSTRLIWQLLIYVWIFSLGNNETIQHVSSSIGIGDEPDLDGAESLLRTGFFTGVVTPEGPGCSSGITNGNGLSVTSASSDFLVAFLGSC
jgi:hypothetical protein